MSAKTGTVSAGMSADAKSPKEANEPSDDRTKSANEVPFDQAPVATGHADHVTLSISNIALEIAEEQKAVPETIAASNSSVSATPAGSLPQIPANGLQEFDFAGLIETDVDPDASEDSSWHWVHPAAGSECALKAFGDPLITGRLDKTAQTHFSCASETLDRFLTLLTAPSLESKLEFVTLYISDTALAGMSFDGAVFVQTCIPLAVHCPALSETKPVAVVINLRALQAALTRTQGVVDFHLDGPAERLHITAGAFTCPLVVYPPGKPLRLSEARLGPLESEAASPLPTAALIRAFAYVGPASEANDIEGELETVMVSGGRAYGGTKTCLTVFEDHKLTGLTIALNRRRLAPLERVLPYLDNAKLTLREGMIALSDHNTMIGLARANTSFPDISGLLAHEPPSHRLAFSRNELARSLSLIQSALRNAAAAQDDPGSNGDIIRLRCARGYPHIVCQLTGIAPDGRTVKVPLTAQRRSENEEAFETRLSLRALLRAINAERGAYVFIEFFAAKDGNELGCAVVLEEGDSYTARTMISGIKAKSALKRPKGHDTFTSSAKPAAVNHITSDQ